jgi:hypothetical protein
MALRAGAILNDVSSVILSPHFDDAVLSCWHVLDGSGEVTVVNIFSGSPPPWTPLPSWDRATGATDAVERMRERREEDRRALAVAGRDALHLGLLDDHYRSAEVRPDAIVTRLETVLAPGGLIYAPAALDRHPDHVLVRDAGTVLGRAGWQLALYADLPHAIRRGWPAWVTGQSAGDVDGEWVTALAESGLAVERLVPRVRPLDARARERKLRSLETYRTQLAGLDRLSFVPLEDPRALSWEVTWGVPRSALDRAPERLRKALLADARREPVDDHG